MRTAVSRPSDSFFLFRHLISLHAHKSQLLRKSYRESGSFVQAKVPPASRVFAIQSTRSSCRYISGRAAAHRRHRRVARSGHSLCTCTFLFQVFRRLLASYSSPQCCCVEFTLAAAAAARAVGILSQVGQVVLSRKRKVYVSWLSSTISDVPFSSSFSSSSWLHYWHDTKNAPEHGRDAHGTRIVNLCAG